MNNKKNKLELRMYGMVNYQLTGIQKGIQFGHAKDEYGLKYFKDPMYQDWLKNWKTYIVLGGGSTNNSEDRPGTMQKHLAELRKNKIKVATFYEPDLEDALTAIVFLVDEMVFNKEKYPDYAPEFWEVPTSIGSQRRLKNWNKSIGKQNLFLRGFLKPFRLA